MKANVQGQCPKCGKFNLEYGKMKLDGESLVYEFECSDCGAKGTEVYNLVYVETQIMD